MARVFIHASDADKHSRIMEDYHLAESQVDAARKRFDKKRANYYFANTAKHWADRANYDLVLNSSTLGIDGCVAVLSALLGKQ